MNLRITILGLSITSSWGNGHATNYRGLVRHLAAAGHDVLFLERDVPWYAANRDLPEPPWGRTELYSSLEELADRFAADVAGSDFVVVGSYVPDGVAVGRWVLDQRPGATAFFDIDTPVTLEKLSRGDFEYVSPDLVARYDLYLSFTGGPTLGLLERAFGSPAARPLYCCVDEAAYYPQPQAPRWDLGYLGTYSDDRQPSVDKLLLSPARRWRAGRFACAGPQYPPELRWPANVERIEHLPPAEHRDFYCRQRFTLNVTRRQMRRSGYSPSVRLFEAAACGTAILTDRWKGLEEFFEVGHEVIAVTCGADVLRLLKQMPEDQRQEMAAAARQKVLSRHTAAHRAEELVAYARQVLAWRGRR